MAVTVTHQKVSAVPDSGDSSVVQPSDWNADHTIVGLGSAAEADVGDFATVTQGAKADTAVQPGDLAAVATSGNYDDLVNAPTLGSAAAADTTDFATAAQGGLADSAVQPGDLATVATTGDYDDLSNTPTLGSAAAASTGDFAAAAAGVPSGGTTGQVLAKASGTDHDTEWVDQASGGGGDAADVTFDPSGTGLSATDVQAAVEEVDARLTDAEEALALLPVAFRAWRSSNYSFTTSDPVPFNQILFNYGGGYDNATGIFTAPSSGLYLFNYNIRLASGSLDDGEEYQIQMMVNDVEVATYYGVGNGTGRQGIQNFLLADLDKDDEVYITTVSNGLTINGAGGAQRYSWFSGVRLASDALLAWAGA